jgi:hypothetical protein
MAAKVRVNDAGASLMAVIDAVEPLPLDDDDDDDDELPQAAARRPSVQTPAVRANVFVIRLKETTLSVESSL